MASVHASADKVWSLLADPSSYANWWDATTESILPPGPARPGQHITAHTRAMGLTWPVTVQVESIEVSRRELTLTTQLPLGITVVNHIAVRPVDAATAQISFG